MERNIFTSYKGTARLRAIRDEGLECIATFKPRKFLIIESATIHVFNDCIIVMGRYEQGKAVCPPDEMLQKTFSAYTKDLKTWHEYKDQFEPAEGYHHAYEYKPHDEPFPTGEW